MAERTLDDIANDVMKPDTVSRLNAAQELQDYLQDTSKPVYCENFDRLVDDLASWVNSSNFKISLAGLECLTSLVHRQGDKFKTHVGTVLPATLDRLGDGKDQVREQAQTLIQILMDPASSPQYVFERLMKAFSHKGWRVREEVLLCLMQTINTFGAGSLTLNKIVPSICKLLGDPNSQVRDTAINTLVEIYRHVGEKVRIDLGKKGIPSSRLSIIYAKFDEVKKSGRMLVTPADNAPKPVTGGDETDSKISLWNTKVKSAIPKTTAVSSLVEPKPAKASTDYDKEGGVTQKAKRVSSTTTPRKISSSSRPSTAAMSRANGGRSTSQAGAVHEDLFAAAFEDVPSVSIYGSKALEDDFHKIHNILNDDKQDWEVRCNNLKRIRSLVVAGATEHDCFLTSLRQLEDSLTHSVKDLRSQVVLEACITLAFLSQKLGRQFDHAAEALLPNLFLLIQNSAKVMATSGTVCIEIILRNTHASRLIPIVKTNLSSKSIPIRKQTSRFLLTILSEWETHQLEKNSTVLAESLRKGIEDPDSEVRAVSRKAFWKFSDHFKQQADKLFTTLDASKQKMLEGELSGSSSSGSLNTTTRLTRKARSNSNSTENLSRGNSSQKPRRSVAAARGVGATESDGGGAPTRLGQRSSSEVNLAAASRARSRYASGGNRSTSASVRIPRSKSTSRENLATRRKRRGLQPPGRFSLNIDPSSDVEEKDSQSMTPGRSGMATSMSNGRSRNRSRIGVSQSQPSSRSSSRSSSPSATARAAAIGINGTSRHRRKSGIPVPRSQGASREASPSRFGFGKSSRDRRHSGSAMGAQREPLSQNQIMAQRVLTTGCDAELALADALNKANRRRWNSEFSDDESDASSVCSVGSYGSGPGRALEVRLADVPEVLAKMASPAWSERKEGLFGLQIVLQSSRVLSRAEIKRVTELFTRMFADPHSKVFSLFLETLSEFVAVHKTDLSDWLFVLITRLLQKMGCDLLGSVLQKVQRALDVVRESFPYDQQFRILTRFIVDQTQTPNAKVKIALLRFMESLTELMDPGDFSNSSETRLAVSRIISWMKEAKNSEVRRCSQSVLIALFELNTPEFSMMLSVLPKSFQDGATKLLHNHLRNATSIDNETSAADLQMKKSPRSYLRVTSPRSNDSSPRGSYASNGPPEFDTENMNSEDIYDSLRRTTAEIQSYMSSSRDDLDGIYKDGHRVDSDEVSADSGLMDSMPDIRVDSPDGKVKEYLEFQPQSQTPPQLLQQPQTNGKSAHNGGGSQPPPYLPTAAQTPTPSEPNPNSNSSYNPTNYQNNNGLTETMNRLALQDAAYEDEQFHEDDQGDALVPLLTELSNHNERFEERRTAMMQLIKMTRTESLTMWDDHFKTVLLLMLETLGDVEPSIRAMALRVLREILRNQPDRFKDYAELTILKILEAHKDQQSEVVRAAEETSATLANSLAPDQSVRVLCPIIQTAEVPVNQAAIKMLTKVVEIMSQAEISEIMEELIPVLLKSYDHAESSIRKASVFCLVAIHGVIGEQLKLYLSDLAGSKMKLLNLYIKRAQAERAGQPASHSPSSPSLSTGSR
ncbi:LOW QUALITY PROTEIN: CLIP-associating protein 1-like [Amphiura filiformis]|uniref:LOW QUALITY PROTEIN: CLIP-associating protein 1-like n=1 Tax=Amphiura filiformis TaxID=82378 RepID=UPI003B222F54